MHEYESQYETTEGRFGWSGIAVAASGVRGRYAADLRSNHGQSRKEATMAGATDTRTQAGILTNAYVEALVGLFALRLEDVKAAVRAHAPGMTVMSSFDGEYVNLDALRVVDELGTSGPEVVAAVECITSAFVARMWDLLPSHAHYSKISGEPEIQFFKHLRNACGHNGRWNFQELKHPASWRGKRLAPFHSGQRVFDGLLKHGDVVLLFVDIDRKYFSSE